MEEENKDKFPTKPEHKPEIGQGSQKTLEAEDT